MDPMEFPFIRSSDPARTGSSICPIALTKVPHLQESSAVSVAISLWNHVNVPQSVWRSIRNHTGQNYPVEEIRNITGLEALVQDIGNLIIRLSLPKLIADIITVYVKKLGYEIQDWIAYHHQAVFLCNGNDFHLYHHIPSFVWYANGTVDYKKTALNLLSSRRLSELEKYKFLCTYCLENELAELVPSLFVDNVVEFVHFFHHPLIFYWNCYFKQELHLVPTSGNLSIDSFMFQQENVNNWWAKEYFFNRLNSEEKVQAAIWLIDQCGVWYQKRVLSMLNQSELIEVFWQRAVQIFSNNLIKTKLPVGEILPMWYDSRAFIDAEQFVSIFEILLQARIDAPILMNVWVSARDDLKIRISINNNQQIVRKIFELQMEGIDDDDNQFLFTVLSDLNGDFKKRIARRIFFRKYCDTLLQKHKSRTFERLMMECFEGEELERFRQDFVLNSSAIKNKFSFYLKGQLEPLNDFLVEILSSRLDLVPEYKKNLLMSLSSITKFAKGLKSTTKILDIILTDGFPTNELKTEFKKRVIFAPAAICTLRSWLILRDRIFDVKSYVDRYLESDEDKKAFKKLLLAKVLTKQAAIFSKYGVVWVEELMYWCLEDEESVQRCKYALNVDAIFNRLFSDVVLVHHKPQRAPLSADVADQNIESEFVHLDRFLNWYFKSQCEVREYKLRRIESYNSIPVMNVLFCRRKYQNHRRSVRRWLFGYDEEKKNIAEFEKKTF